jgi:plastocyanin
MNKNIIIAIVVVIVLAVGGWLIFGNSNDKNSTTPTTSSNSGSTAETNSNSSNSNTSQPTATNSVSMADMSFSPASITVKKGTKVTWTNNDSLSHTVTADDSSFGSDTLSHGTTFSHTFDTAGTFAYHCNFHSNMHGTVVVQ